MAKTLDWQLISLPALNAPFDARSVPSDILLGAFRWKQNFAVNSTGRLSRRTGHSRLVLNAESDTNDDYHDQELGSESGREVITNLYEHLAPDGTRRLICCTPSRIQFHNGTQWVRVGSGLDTQENGSPWSMTAWEDLMVFSNNVDRIKQWTVPDGTLSTVNITDGGKSVTAARIVIQAYGHFVLMNTVESGERLSYRVRWSQWSRIDSWASNTDTNAGWQDLEPGEEILAAAPLQGSWLIYTSKSIYRMYYTGEATTEATDATAFGFQRVYHEPKSRIGCLAYPNTLVSTGDCHRYMGRDGIYKWTPYMTEPEREDWIHASSAVIFNSRYSSQIDSNLCENPIAEAFFDDEGNAREILFSWTSKGAFPYNSHSLACNVQFKTCDYIDTGYTALVNFNPKDSCNSGKPMFIAASGADWCLKELGDVFYREEILMPLAELILNVGAGAPYVKNGYNTILRGEIPASWIGIEKTVRRIIVEHETEAQTTPCKLRLRIADARMIRDCNIGVGLQAVQWSDDLPEINLESPDERTVADLTINNLRPDYQTDFFTYRIGRHLYYEFTIKGAGAALAVGGRTEWARIDFEVKPGA